MCPSSEHRPGRDAPVHAAAETPAFSVDASIAAARIGGRPPERLARDTPHRGNTARLPASREGAGSHGTCSRSLGSPGTTQVPACGRRRRIRRQSLMDGAPCIVTSQCNALAVLAVSSARQLRHCRSFGADLIRRGIGWRSYALSSCFIRYRRISSAICSANSPSTRQRPWLVMISKPLCMAGT